MCRTRRLPRGLTNRLRIGCECWTNCGTVCEVHRSTVRPNSSCPGRQPRWPRRCKTFDTDEAATTCCPRAGFLVAIFNFRSRGVQTFANETDPLVRALLLKTAFHSIVAFWGEMPLCIPQAMKILLIKHQPQGRAHRCQRIRK